MAKPLQQALKWSTMAITKVPALLSPPLHPTLLRPAHRPHMEGFAHSVWDVQPAASPWLASPPPSSISIIVIPQRPEVTLVH